MINIPETNEAPNATDDLAAVTTGTADVSVEFEIFLVKE